MRVAEFIGCFSMQTTPGDATANPQRDLFFKCEHCATLFVVDVAAAGMKLECQSCRKTTSVPSAGKISTAPGGSELLAELQRHLRENDSQRTEVKGYINQMAIQLHRWQLRLQSLEERHQELTGKLAALEGGT